MILSVLSGLILASSPILIPWANGTNSPNVFPPNSEPYGFTLGEWSAKSWQLAFSTPPASEGQPSGIDSDKSCFINHIDPVVELIGAGGEGGAVKHVCTIPSGKALLVPILAGMCSYADTPNAKSDSELRSCAMSGNEGALIEVSIDGEKLQDINGYRVQSPPFDLNIAEGNLFGVSPGPTRAVADCWCIMIKPLPVGRHVIQHTVSIVGNPTIGTSAFATEVTYDLIVEEEQFMVTPHAVSVTGIKDEIILPINSSSNVTDFRFNEPMKQILFKVSGEDENGGIVMFPISRALEGPYTVTVDGNVMTNFEIINNQTSSESNIKISYSEGIHDIIIVGTNVIPEFPTSVVGILILALAIGLIMTFSRMQHLTPR